MAHPAYTEHSNATTGDRLLNVGNAAVQLSTGDLVMLTYAPDASDPNKIALELVPAPAHSAPQLIGTLSSNAGTGGVDFCYSGTAQSLALCVDASDNIYVVGSSGFNSVYIAVQAFVKQVGVLAWTQAAASYTVNSLATGQVMTVAAAWCNTGGGTGGAGHIYIMWNDSNGYLQTDVEDAGKVLAGLLGASTWGGGSLGGYNYPNPNITAASGANLDLASDGFGALTGLYVGLSATAGNVAGVGPWAVNSMGNAIDLAATATVACAALSATTKLRVVRYASGQFAVLVPSATNAGQISVRSWGSNAVATGAIVDSGTAGSFPTPSAGLSWDVVAAPPVAKQIWLYGWKTGAATVMVRESVTFNATGTATTHTAISDDGAAAGSSVNTTIRTLHRIVDWQHADWQAYSVVSGTPGLIGDFSLLPAPPLPPVLTFPLPGASWPANPGGTATWTYQPSFPGDVQTGYYFMRQINGGAKEYWKGTTNVWQAAEFLNSSALGQTIFGSGKWALGWQGVWAVDAVNVVGRSGYCQTQPVGISNASPTAPTLTASFDPTQNRTTLTLFSTDATGPTGSIERSDDGGATWQFVLGATALVINPGTASLFDYDAPAGSSQYRGRSWTAYPNGYSPYSTVTVTVAVTTSWLKDATAGTAVALKVQKGTMTSQFSEDVTVHSPLGRSLPVTIADAIHGEDGTATWQALTLADQEALEAIMNLQKPLFLQTPTEAWWIRVIGARAEGRLSDISGAFLRATAVTWVEVDRPSA